MTTMQDQKNTVLSPTLAASLNNFETVSNKQEKNTQNKLLTLALAAQTMRKELEKVQAGVSTNSSSQSSDSQDDVLTKITLSMAALSLKAINEAMALYTHIIQLEQLQRQTEINAQTKTMVDAYKATRRGGEALWKSAIQSGCISSGMVLLGLVGQAAVLRSGNSEFNRTGDQVGGMKQIDDALPIDKGNTEVGNINNPKVNNLQEDFENGNYSRANKATKEEVQVAVDQIRDNSNIDFARWKQTFKEDYSRAMQEHNANAQRISQNSSYAQTVNTLSSSLGQSGSTIASGYGQKEKASEDANATVAQGMNRLQDEAASQFAKGADSAFSSQSSEMQIFKELSRSQVGN